MMLWVALTAITSFAAILVAAPFLRDWDRRAVFQERDIFREQLEEIERECARGNIDPASAEAASIEIKRRLLSARETDDTPSLNARERAFAAVGVSGIVTLGAVGLFAITGGQAPTSRTEVAAETSSKEALTPSVGEMIDRLEKRLQFDPNDATGWRTLGWARLQTEAYAEAAKAYARAIALQPEAADSHSARAEALIKSAGELVHEEARTEIDAALGRDPKDARARYWLGVAQKQKGERDAARETWRAMLADGLEKDVASEVEKEIAALDADARPQSPTDASDIVHSMVDGLEQRLSSAPNDVEGWIRLVKSRMVLGETDKAYAALSRAREVFATESDARRRIEDAAKEVGL